MRIHLPDYHIGQNIHQSERSSVFRARCLSSNQSVIIKLLGEDYPEPAEAARFKHEYRITRRLAGERVIKVRQLLPCGHGWAMVLDDGGTSVNHLIGRYRDDPAGALALALALVDALGDVHAHGVVHKDINPSNMVLDDDNRVRLIDFGIASELRNERLEPISDMRFEGTPAYLAPEQTGRINRAVDYRSDFYATGVTLFEIFTGQPPFPGRDVLELVHAHIARTPPDPCQLNPALPAALGGIILKLLAKPAEERYQSLYGLRHDLTEVQTQLNSRSAQRPFELARHERFDRLQIPEKLYGRAESIERIQAALEQAATGEARMLTVAGASGIGKTALIREFSGPTSKLRGLFVSGKCDQYTRLPYHSLLQALRPLLKRLAQGSERDRWREHLTRSLGDEAHVLVAVLPELNPLVDDGETRPAANAVEQHNRFFSLMRKLVSTLCREGQPLVLFLDDLQWADGNSLKLLRHLLSSPESQYLLIIGAYRDNDVDASHPLKHLLDDLRTDEKLAAEVHVGPLALDDISQLLAETLHVDQNTARSLAVICRQKTDGNPFFLEQFLKTLKQRKLVRFDPSAGHWSWQDQAIANASITDNVVDLMIERLMALDAACLRIVQYAACIGNRFDLRGLAIASASSLQQTADALWPAIASDLIVPVDANYRLTGSEFSDLGADNAHYRFLHDRVQQAAYDMLDSAIRRRAHASIGQRLLRVWQDNDGDSDQLFEAVNHLNLGSVQGADEQLLEVNRLAGERALASGAFGPAFDYFDQALKSTPESGQQGRDWISLVMRTAESAFLSGAIERGDHLIRQLNGTELNRYDRARLRHLEVRLYTIIGRIEEALEAALAGLEIFGLTLPRDPQAQEKAASEAVQQLLKALPEHDIDSLLDAPEIRDPEILLQQQLLTDMGGAAYTLNARLYVLAYLTLGRLALTHGNSPWSAYGYATLASTLARLGQYERADALGEVAQEACFRFNGEDQLAKVRFIVSAFVCHWRHGHAETQELLELTFNDGLRSGDLLHANYALMFVPFCLWYAEKPLSEVIAQAKRYLAFSRHTDTAARQATVELARHAALNLSGETLASDSLSTPTFQEATAWAAVNAAGAGICRVFKLQTLYLRGELSAAQTVLAEAEARAPFFSGMMMEAGFVFYAGLLSCALLRKHQTSGQQQTDASCRQRLRDCDERLRIWADGLPATFRHKQLLLEAEIASLEGQTDHASGLYGKAIEQARVQGFVASEALASELAARHFSRIQLHDVAKPLYTAAYRAWRTWGATACADVLKQEFPGIERRRRSNSLNTSLTGQFDHIDASSVIKASQAIASEIKLEALLRQFLSIILENAGARRAALALDEGDGRLRLTAVAHLDEAHTQLYLDDEPPQPTNDDYPWALFEYVQRTGQTITRGRSQDETLLHRYLEPHELERSRSLACLALLNQQRTVGVLLLENRLVEGAFTPEHVAVLEMLASQAAMSILNARLYSHMEQQVRTRTRQLREKAEQLEAANELLEKLSITDPLTRLSNRRFVESRLESDVAQVHRHYGDSGSGPDGDLTFFLIDLDYFKQVNDRYGHEVGDRVLRKIARVLDEVFRESDYRVRWGGEEFLAVARFSNRSRAPDIAERLRATVAATPIKLSTGDSINVTCSIGFAPLPLFADRPEMLSWQQVVRLADSCMYLTKAAGRDGWTGVDGQQAPTDGQLDWLLDNPLDACSDEHLRLLRPT